MREDDPAKGTSRHSPRSGLDDPIRCGAATLTLPTPTGARLAGYTDRIGRASGAHDSLEVTAIALRDQHRTAVVVAVDLLAVDQRLVENVATAAGLRPGEILLAASHTHSGPGGIADLPDRNLGGPVDTQLRAEVSARIAAVIDQALDRAEPASCRVARVQVPGVASNRNEASRPVDDRVTVVSIEGPDSRPVAVMLHFACHPTVLGHANLRFSADLPGAFRHEFAARGGLPDVPILFLNGASGDVSTRFTRRAQDFREVRRLGRMLAHGAEAALLETPYLPIVPLEVAHTEVCLPAKPLPSVSEAEDTLKRHVDRLRLGDEATVAPAERRQLFTRVQGAAAELARADGSGITAEPVLLTAVRLGELALLGISAEVASGIGGRIERCSPFGETVIVSLAGGYNGYVVDTSDQEEETYEALASPFAGSSDDVLVAEAATLLRSMQSGG